MNVLTKENCRDWYSVKRITDGMICAIETVPKNMTKKTKISPCHGDSGGPLIVSKSSSDDTAVVIGVSSWINNRHCNGL